MLRIALVTALFLALGVAVEQNSYNPIANPKAVVQLGSARFTVLTPMLIRMEYSSGSFEDRPTWAVLNRNTPVPPFTVGPSKTRPGWTEIRTAALSVQYNPTLQRSQTAFDSTSLVVQLLQPVGTNTNVTWVPGQASSGNLLGTIRSLDQIDGAISLNCTQNANIRIHEESLHCAWGLISRDGWVVLDNTAGPYLDQNEWPMNLTSADTIDMYFFGHGHNYKQALQDYALIGLPVPMTPKYVHGIMWSRWYWISSSDLPYIVSEYTSRNMPLDIFIIDMDWHLSQPPGQSGEPYWTGFSWDPNLFPYPSAILGPLKERGLHFGVNIHDFSGVQNFETYYAPMAIANGIDPKSGTPVPFDCTSPQYMDSLHDIVMQPLVQDGIDFWWTDWQQGETPGVHVANVNPTYMTNWYRATRQASLVARGKNTTAQIRGWTLARWGGLGNHRYQTGFSGDVSHTWESLAFQPYFTATATNFSFHFCLVNLNGQSIVELAIDPSLILSHDIMGGGLDYELSTRWIQWGALSPLFRTHDAGGSAGSCADQPGECSLGDCDPVEVWNVPNYNFEINRRAIRLRASLLPYFYTLHRLAYDTGLGPARPMYYNFPELDLAYQVPDQYNLGDDLIVAPVIVPGDKSTQLAVTTVWLPPGTWVDREFGTVHVVTSASGQALTKAWDLSEIPIFIRGGAVIPSIPDPVIAVTGNAYRQYPALMWTIYPGGTLDSGRAYDDDGMSMGYQDQVGAWYSCSYKRTPAATSIILSIDMFFPGQLTIRPYTVKMVNELPPQAVIVNGTLYNFSVVPQPETWSFDPIDLAVVISIPAFNTTGWNFDFKFNTVIKVVSNLNYPQGLTLSGVRGVVQRSALAKAQYDEVRVERNNYASVLQSREVGFRLSIQANNATYVTQTVSTLKATVASGVAQMQSVSVSNPARKARAVALIQGAYAEL